MAKNESAKEDLRLLYQACVGDIAFFKQQQWRVTNYAVLSYVAIITGAQLAANTTKASIDSIEKCVALLLVVAVAVGATYTIFSLSRSLRGARDSIDQIRPHLSSAFRKCYEVKWARVKRPSRDLPFPFLFYFYVIGGGTVALWVIYRWY